MRDPKKGLYNGECYRTACDNDEAVYYNRVTKQNYCWECAEGINGSAKQSGMEPLCAKQPNSVKFITQE